MRRTAFRVAMSELRPEHKRRAPRGILGRAAHRRRRGGARPDGDRARAGGQRAARRGRRGRRQQRFAEPRSAAAKADDAGAAAEDAAVDDQGIPTPAYAPASAGATPDTDETRRTPRRQDPKSRSSKTATTWPTIRRPRHARPRRPSAPRKPARRPARRRIRPPNGWRRRRRRPPRTKRMTGTTGTVRAQDRRQRDRDRTRSRSSASNAPRRSKGSTSASTRTLTLRSACASAPSPSCPASRAASPGRRTPIPAPTASPALLSESTLRLNAVSDWASDKATHRCLRQLPQDDLRRGDRRDARRPQRRVRTRARTRLDGAWIDRLRDWPGIGLGSRRDRRHARPADRADLRRQPRRREGYRQGAAPADRQCRTPGFRRCRAFDRRHGFAGRPQYDAGRGRAAHRLRDLTGVDAVRRVGIRPALLRPRCRQ